MLLATLLFLLFGSITAAGAGAIARHFRGSRAGWIAGISTLLAFVCLYLALYFFVMVPLGELE